MKFRQFLYGVGLSILVMGAVFGLSAWFGGETILLSFVGLLTLLIPFGFVAVFFFAIAKVLEYLENMVLPIRRTEERLEKILRKMEELEERDK